MYRAQLRWQPIATLLVLALVWGANMAVIKIGARELPPLFMAGLRSLVASACLYIWIKAKGLSLFPSIKVLLHGVVIGFRKARYFLSVMFFIIIAKHVFVIANTQVSSHFQCFVAMFL